MILILDNYDSFTYNLVQYIGSMNPNIQVSRNDQITINDIKRLLPERIVISPGPGHPEDAGLSIEIIKKFKDIIPILGICLGHQAITLAFGGNVIRANEIMHGKTSKIKHSGSGIYKGISNDFTATRYHSLVADENTFPDELNITATTEGGLIMSLEHKEYPIYGLQYHPESILTENGIKLIKNFLKV